MTTLLIVGLGNPGPKYTKTRHNAGFMLVDYFRENETDLNFSEWEFNKKLNSESCSGKFEGKKIIILKPQTFMNLSGEAVAAAMKYYKIPIRGETSNNLIVVHDEIDLPLGTFRVSQNASSAGHQGVQNIIDQLGTKDFSRLRIGVDDRKEKKIATEKYVLGKFTKDEFKLLLKIIEELSKELKTRLLIKNTTK